MGVFVNGSYASSIYFSSYLHLWIGLYKDLIVLGANLVHNQHIAFLQARSPWRDPLLLKDKAFAVIKGMINFMILPSDAVDLKPLVRCVDDAFFFYNESLVFEVTQPYDFLYKYGI